jgi:hypothetical protein
VLEEKRKLELPVVENEYRDLHEKRKLEPLEKHQFEITEKLTVEEKYAGLKEKHEWERLEKLNVVGGGRAPK